MLIDLSFNLKMHILSGLIFYFPLIEFVLYLPEIMFDIRRQQQNVMAIDYAESMFQAYCIIIYKNLFVTREGTYNRDADFSFVI